MRYFKALIFVFFVLMPCQLFSKHFFVDYLSGQGYECVKAESYKEITNYINAKIYKNQYVVYVEREDVVFGFIVFDDLHPCPFVVNDDFLTIFFPNPLVDGDDLYNVLLNNIYSASHIDFDGKRVSYIMFNYGFQYAKPVVNTYRKDAGSYMKSSIRVDSIPYPQFIDTTTIKKYYRDFCVDVNSRMENLRFKSEDHKATKMMDFSWGLIDYRCRTRDE